MFKVFKYPLAQAPLGQRIEVSMPFNAEILHVGMQDKVVTLWAMVDPQERCGTRYFSIFGTGQEIQSYTETKYTHLGTVFDREYVWHIFEEVWT